MNTMIRRAVVFGLTMSVVAFAQTDNATDLKKIQGDLNELKKDIGSLKEQMKSLQRSISQVGAAM